MWAKNPIGMSRTRITTRATLRPARERLRRAAGLINAAGLFSDRVDRCSATTASWRSSLGLHSRVLKHKGNGSSMREADVRSQSNVRKGSAKQRTLLVGLATLRGVRPGGVRQFRYNDSPRYWRKGCYHPNDAVHHSSEQRWRPRR